MKIRQHGILLCIICLYSGFVFGQVTLKVELTELDTGEPIVGASIVDLNSGYGAISNAMGFGEISSNAGPKTYIISHVGFIRDTLQINLIQDTLVSLRMSSLSINEVVIIKEEPLHRQTMLGKISLSTEKIEQIPSSGDISTSFANNSSGNFVNSRIVTL